MRGNDFGINILGPVDDARSAAQRQAGQVSPEQGRIGHEHDDIVGTGERGQLLFSAAVEIAVTANAGAEAAELMVCSRAMDDDPLMGAGCLPGTNDMHGPAAGG